MNQKEAGKKQQIKKILMKKSISILVVCFMFFSIFSPAVILASEVGKEEILDINQDILVAVEYLSDEAIPEDEEIGDYVGYGIEEDELIVVVPTIDIIPFSAVPVNTWDMLRDTIDNASGSVEIIITDNLTTNLPRIAIPADLEVTLLADSDWTISGTGGGALDVSGILNLGMENPAAGQDGSLTFSDFTSISPFNVSIGTFNMHYGTISNNTTHRGAVFVNFGTFTMYGGTISDNINIHGGAGGGVDVVGVFNMHDGTISGNEARAGGGVFFNGIFNMYGGTISGNEATGGGGGLGTGAGGGVSFSDFSTFNMYGGTISDNTAINGAGVNVFGNGIFALPVHHSTFIMNGGTISGNIATGNGGGVNVINRATFEMNYGTISGNTATNGGGVNVDDYWDVFEMNDGKIFDNTANADGGGVRNHGNFIMSDGEISGNTANYRGGGVENSGTFEMTGGIISNNIVYYVSGYIYSGTGGGVFVGFEGAFTMEDGIISDNTAPYGGGIYVMDDSILEVVSGSIIGNTAKMDGGGIFTENYEIGPIPTPGVAFNNIEIGEEVIFANNSAGNGSFPPPVNAEDFIKIQFASTSVYEHPLNNYDINFYNTRISVTFKLQGGNIDGYTNDVVVRVAYGRAMADVLEIVGVPERTNYRFQGWAETATGSAITDWTGRVIEEDIAFYARWQSTNVGGGTGSRPGGGGGGGAPEEPVTLPEEVPDPEVPDFVVTFSADHEAYLIGFPDGTIRPNNTITRAEVATIFFRLFDDSYRTQIWRQSNPFSDVVSTNWFNNAVSTLANADVLTGFPDGTFRGNQAITRAEFVAIVARFIEEPAHTGTDRFNDISGHWAREYINSVGHYDWIRGFAGGDFRPNQSITRAEAAAIVNRMLNRLPETSADLLPGMVTWSDNMNQNAWFYLYIQEATNSHDHEMKADGVHERWTELREPRDWTELERPNSGPQDIR